ncbi:hypothetical protein SLEP1_g20400 [Rubroshorea leprosula]|uniref:Uncharacterized protein n=1 Tax=Rubroshorea leprosula TaxID=152421 RepID=A0AAV5J2L3_9ROSI|nr:hypothetical protein SLEP1_g20400 [Rubroshorea leprosula]
MHDFCFTILYGLILVVGGIVGYLRKGSMVSLAGGGGAGLVLILARYLSLKAFEMRKNLYFTLVLETGKILPLCLKILLYFCVSFFGFMNLRR